MDADPRGLAYSPDGKRLAVGMLDGTIALFDTANRERIFTLKGHTAEGNIYGLAFAPDSRTLASAGHDGTVRLWDLPQEE